MEEKSKTTQPEVKNNHTIHPENPPLLSEYKEVLAELINSDGFSEIPKENLPDMLEIMDFSEVSRGFSLQISNENIDTDKPWSVLVDFADMSNGAASFNIVSGAEAFRIFDNRKHPHHIYLQEEIASFPDLYLVVEYWSADAEDNGVSNTAKFALSEIQHFTWGRYQIGEEWQTEIIFKYMNFVVSMACRNLFWA